MNEGKHISQEDLALYAMQTLPSAESAAIGVHISECAECSAELAEIFGDLAMLSLSVEQHPVPAGARERFLANIAATQPAVVPAPPIPISTARRASKPSYWIPWLAAAAMAILAVSLTVKLNQLQQRLRSESDRLAQLSDDSARARLVVELLDAPTAQHVLLTAAQSPVVPTGRAIYLANRGSLIFQASGLKPLPQDKVYELWLIPADGRAPMPAGLFRPNATGIADVVLPPLPKNVPAKAFGVTIEKAEGSATPTAPIILAGAPTTPGE
jgi:anti-sigma-K factor RskA